MAEDEQFITFMRHGRSQADDEQVHEGRYDSPLTDVGRNLVHRRARRWLEDGVQFEFGDAGYYETVYIPRKHHWMMRCVQLSGPGGEG